MQIYMLMKVRKVLILVYKRIYGVEYKSPPTTRSRKKREINGGKRHVTFADKPIILNAEEFLNKS